MKAAATAFATLGLLDRATQRSHVYAVPWASSCTV
jgi:hypothetical protein